MPVEFDTDYYLNRAAEIEKKAKTTASRIAFGRLRVVLAGAKTKHTPILDVLDFLEEEAGTKNSVFSRKLRDAVTAIRLRKDLEP